MNKHDLDFLSIRMMSNLLEIKTDETERLLYTQGPFAQFQPTTSLNEKLQAATTIRQLWLLFFEFDLDSTSFRRRAPQSDFEQRVVLKIRDLFAAMDDGDRNIMRGK